MKAWIARANCDGLRRVLGQAAVLRLVKTWHTELPLDHP